MEDQGHGVGSWVRGEVESRGQEKGKGEVRRWKD